MKAVAVIPARYKSTRFPGKPLVDIYGKPMIWWVYQQVSKVSALEGAYVATDDSRIENVCKYFHIPVKMTGEHGTAANRIYEFSQMVDADFYITVNGDEPLIDPGAISSVIPTSVSEETIFASNIITNIEDPVQLMDPSNIKVVFDNEFNALYMSRAPIPYPSKDLNFTYYKHVGVIGYNKNALRFYNDSRPGTFERIEGIDTLRFIDYGKKLKLIYYPCYCGISVDTPKDLDIVQKILEKRTKERDLNFE